LPRYIVFSVNEVGPAVPMMPRFPAPSLADASSHTGISPPGTRELPAQDTTWDDTVVQCAAELLLGPVDTRTISNKDSVWPDRLENHLYLATCYTGMHRRMLDAYAAELSAIDGLNVRPRRT